MKHFPLIINVLAAAFTFCLPAAEAQSDYPGPVTNVQASDGSSSTEITVSWSAPTEGATVSSYKVFRSESNTFCPAPSITTVLAPLVSFTDTPPEVDKIYYYSVRAVSDSSGSELEGDCVSTDAGYAGALPKPEPPINITATETLYDKITVSWEDPTSTQPIEEYHLYRATSEQFCQGDPMVVLSSEVTTYNDTSALAGQGYYYSLKSSGPTGTGRCSAADRGFRVEPPPPFPPTNLEASDGTFEDKVRVIWEEPSSGGEITNYTLHRSETEGSSCSSVLKTGLAAGAVNFDDQINVVPGRLYYYSMESTGPGGASQDCSNLDPGFARIGPAAISATDGDFTNKVTVTWEPPANGGDITGYNVYKSSSSAPCQGELVSAGGFAAGTTSYIDTSVTPGTTYYYSVEVVSPTGVSSCSEDPGYAVTECSDGKDNDKDGLIDYPNDPGCSGLEDNDEIDLPECSDGLDNDGDGKIDYPVDPGCSSSNDDNEEDLPECSDGVDNDGDGLVDFPDDPGCSDKDDDDEQSDEYVCDNGLDDDGDGKIDFRVDGSGDPGCESPTDPSEDDSGAALKSPAFAKFNTFLGQWNFAELINQGEKDKDVTMTLFNLRGEVMLERTIVVPAESEVDVDINSLVLFACDVLNSGCEGFEDLSETRGYSNGLGRPDGIVDTYGLVQFVFDDSDTDERLLGRISFYRPNEDGSFSFAFSREFRNPSTGKTYALANTYDPQGMGYLVPNWAEVIAFGKRQQNGEFEFSQQHFTLNIYAQDGSLRDTREVTLPGLGEFDFHAGHEFVDAFGVVQQNVYLVEVIPDDPEAEYFLTVSRYSSNGPPASDPDTYNYALALQGNSGTTEAVFAPIANQLSGLSGLSSNPVVTNWVETANVGQTEATVLAVYRDASGTVIARQNETLAPKAQVHFNAGAVLTSGSSGSIEIYADGPVIAQSMSYVHGSNNRPLSGFVAPARTRGRKELTGTINTFLKMQNVLGIFSTAAEDVEASFELTSFRGGISQGTLDLPSGSLSSVTLSDNENMNFPADTYGALKLSTKEEGLALSSVYRVRLTEEGTVDFVMVTPVQ